MNPSNLKTKQPKNQPEANGKPSKINAGQGTSDPRFAKVNFDPKFMPMSKKDKKIEVDDRFKSMLNNSSFSAKPKADKYGRKNAKNEKNKELEDLYYVKGQEDEVEDEEDLENEDIEDSDAEDEAEEPKKKSKTPDERNKKHENKKQNKNKSKDSKGPQLANFDKNGRFEWDEESSSSEIDVVEMQKMLDGEDEDEWKSEDDDVPLGDATKRIAMVNYDWENIRPGDIMLFLSSFCPKNGFIKSVTIYPSDFGLERMNIEAEQGPADIWKANRKSGGEKEIEKLDKSIVDADTNWVYKDSEDTDLDPKKLRKYEKDKMKYYYAVIECDSVATAKQIYDNCEGLEFELTAIKIDLRYIPDKLKFPHKPKEVCTELPVTSKVNNFLNRAVQHTNVKLTWEEPNLNRFDPILKNVKNGDFGNIDFSQIMNSDDSESDSDEEIIEAKRKALLGGKTDGGETADWRDDFDKSRKKKAHEKDMVIKFNPGFSEGGNKILEKPTLRNDINSKRKNIKANEEDDFFVDDEDDLLIPVHKTRGPKNDKSKDVQKDQKLDKKQQDELALLVDDVEDKKGFKLNLEDDRFKSFTKSEYAIDPTSKYYDGKKAGNLLQEQVQLREKSRK